MSETVYASDLCKLYLENKEITNLDQKFELYNQICDDLFRSSTAGAYQHIVFSYRIIEYSEFSDIVRFEMIDFVYKIHVKYLTFHDLKTFVKRNHIDSDYDYYDYYDSRYDSRYSSINASLFENLMEKIELLIANKDVNV